MYVALWGGIVLLSQKVDTVRIAKAPCGVFPSITKFRSALWPIPPPQGLRRNTPSGRDEMSQLAESAATRPYGSALLRRSVQRPFFQKNNRGQPEHGHRQRRHEHIAKNLCHR